MPGLAFQANVIDPELQSTLKSLDSNEEIPLIITMSDKVNPKGIKDKDKGLRRSKLIKALKNKADVSQKPLRAFLKSKGLKHVLPLWIINGMAVTVRVDVIDQLVKQPGIESIRLDDTLNEPEFAPATLQTPEWNLDLIRASELWSLGYTGDGVVVASMDTGVDVNHPDLAVKWRGGSNSWYDPNGEHLTPYDKTGHGTKVMGLIVGGDAGGSAIGVAPGALWIAVKIFNDAGVAYICKIHQSFQWILDPDNQSDTNDAPDIVNNSWGFSDNTDECITEFQEDIQMLKAAGIAVVFSGGNGGPYPHTSVSPANYQESFAVGAVDDSRNIASFSSRGPGACSDDYHPGVVAPGVNVKTSDITFGGMFPNSYAFVSGTSIAAPHAAGAMALLLEVFPSSTAVDLESALKNSALDLGPTGPDHDYGYGLLDVMEAYNFMNQIIDPCEGDFDGDGDVDGSDLSVFAAEFGRTDCGEPTTCPGDFDNDGDVDGNDLAVFPADFGRTDCP